MTTWTPAFSSYSAPPSLPSAAPWGRDRSEVMRPEKVREQREQASQRNEDVGRQFEPTGGCGETSRALKDLDEHESNLVRALVVAFPNPTVDFIFQVLDVALNVPKIALLGAGEFRGLRNRGNGWDGRLTVGFGGGHGLSDENGVWQDNGDGQASSSNRRTACASGRPLRRRARSGDAARDGSHTDFQTLNLDPDPSSYEKSQT